MGLPAANIPWPPIDAVFAYDRYREYAAWYSGSATDLQRYYAGYAGQDRTGFFDPSTTAQPLQSVFRFFKFWARQDPSQVRRNRIHIPLAADIAATSSDQLFGDPPLLIIPEAHIVKATRKAKAIQDRLNELIDEDRIHTTFLEAGEIAAALGGVFLRVSWDKDLKDRPILTAVHPDRALPEFAWGQLAAVTFWTYLGTDKDDVFRHIERHEPGVILHGLYKGSTAKLGIPVALSERPETAGFEAVIQTGLGGLDCVYIPNMRPNRKDRSSWLGRSDYDGCEDMMDALDETWTSLLRDIRLGKARGFVPEEYISSKGKGKGGQFDVDQEFFEQLKMVPTDKNYGLTMQQAQIRTQEHMDAAEALIERIIATSGYSASTFGLRGAATVERTATEVMARENRTQTTRGKKIEYWQPLIADVFEIMLQVDEMVFGGPGSMRPRADFPETVHDSLLDTANAIALLSQAQAISTQRKVELANPTWGPEEVAAEVARLIPSTAAVAASVSAGILPAAPTAPQPTDPSAVLPPGVGAMVQPPSVSTQSPSAAY